MLCCVGLQISASLLRTICLSDKLDFGTLKDFLIPRAAFIYDWLLSLETRARAADSAAAAGAGGAGSAAVGGGNCVFPLEQVTRAFQAMTLL